MSSAEHIIYTALSKSADLAALVDTRIYSDVVRPNAKLPYVVFFPHVSCIPHTDMKGDTGYATVRVQIDCVSTKPDDARAIALAVRSALKSKAVLQDQADDPEPERGIYRASLDYTVFEEATL